MKGISEFPAPFKVSDPMKYKPVGCVFKKRPEKNAAKKDKHDKPHAIMITDFRYIQAVEDHR